jgi:hypothetical protein
MPMRLQEPSHVDEPQQAKEYADVPSRVAADKQAVIVRRGGADLAAVVPLELLEFLQDAFAMEKAERMAAAMDLEQFVKDHPPPQIWFDRDEPKPF